MSHFSSRRGRPARDLLQACCAVCRRPLLRGARRTNADYYVKRYRSVGFALSLLSYFLLGRDSLRSLTAELADNQRLGRLTGLGGISKAQLPKLLQRPPELWEPLLAHLLKRLQPRQVPAGVQILDTTFFVLGCRLFGRHFAGNYTPHTAGYKAAIVLDLASGAPLRALCRAGQSNDAQYLDELVPAEADIAGTLFLFDRGFRRYRFYEALVDRGAGFITRCWQKRHYRVIKQRPLSPQCPQIVRDDLVAVGKGPCQLRHRLRHIVLQGERGPVEFLTSDLELSALEITELYRRRWQIETFFRWLKQVIGCRRPLGYTLSAALHTLYAALACYLLLLLYGGADLKPDECGRMRGLKNTWLRLRRRLWERPTVPELACLGFL